MTNPFFIVFDSETTGVEPGSRPVEIAALKVDSVLGDIIDQFCTLVNPGMPIPPDMLKINKIDDGQVVGAPTLKDACAKFLEFIQGAEFLMAHNAIYDVGILSWAIGFSLSITASEKAKRTERWRTVIQLWDITISLNGLTCQWSSRGPHHIIIAT